MDIISISAFAGIALVGTVWGYIQVQRSGRLFRFVNRLREEDPLYLSERWDNIRYQWQIIGAKEAKTWERCVVFLGHKRLSLYPYLVKETEPAPILSIQPHELRGFWRPLAYHADRNEVQIHAQIGENWAILCLKIYQYEMHDFIRAIKEISTPEQVKAYRRQRPYPQRGLAPAHPAEQSLTGEWTVFNPIELYLMPLHLIVFKQGSVQKVFDLDKIQQLAALKRMEGGKPEGLIRFTYEDTPFAFALDDYEVWQPALPKPPNAASKNLCNASKNPKRMKRKIKETSSTKPIIYPLPPTPSPLRKDGENTKSPLMKWGEI